MDDKNNDVYYEDNSFDNQGVEYQDDSSGMIPNQNRATNGNMVKDFAKGVGQGIKGNPALGQRGPGRNDMPGKTNSDDIPKKKSDGSDLNNKNNPAKGQNSNNSKDKNDSNKLPGAKKDDNTPNKLPGAKKDGNTPNKGNSGNQGNKPEDKKGGLASKLGNKNGKNGLFSRSGSAAKAATGGKGGASKGASSKIGELAGQGLKKLFMALPPQGKIIMVAVMVILPVILVFGLFLLSLLTGTTAVVVAATASCGSATYGSDFVGEDAMSFMCSMMDPVENSNYNVSSIYGWRSFNKTRMHRGIDLAGDSGTPILAVHDGEVVAIATGQCYECGEGYGNYVLLKHGDTIHTMYAHLKTVSVEVGNQVTKGQQIGARGSTGGSTGPHLHFEVRNGPTTEDSVSVNAFFGYSDEGYEKCLDPSSGYQSGCDKSSAREMGDDGFAQACGISGNYVSSGSSGNRCCGIADKNNKQSGLDIVSFVKIFEGVGGYCDSGKTKYKAYQNSGDRVTIGFGVTSDFIPYLDHAGQCIDVDTVDKAGVEALDVKRSFVQEKFKDANLTIYEEDAMTSMAYNGCRDFFTGIAAAAKNDNYEEIWNAMKGCRNKGTIYQQGLERRRKAEFALYVTGDYSVASEYKTKSWTESEYNDFDSDNVMAKKATGTSSVCNTGSGDKSKVVEIAIRELEANQGISESAKCTNIKNYLKSCGYTGTHHYCAGFVTYVLKEAGVFDYVGLPSYTCMVTNFKNPTGGEFHKAGGSYIPEPGDLVISRNWGHIMIVEKVEGETVHIIGGNQSPFNVSSCPNNGAGTSLGNVTRNTYSLNSSTLDGYISYNVPSSVSGGGSAENMKSYNSYKTLKTFKIGDLTKKANVTTSGAANIAQSFTVVDDHYVVALMNRAETTSSIRSYKTSSGKLVNSLSGKFGHGNGMAYNNKTGKILLTNQWKHKTYWKIDAKSAISGNKLSYTKHTFDNYISSIEYDRYNNRYYRGSGSITVHDSDLKKVKGFDKIRSRVSQDIGAYNGVVFAVEDITTSPKKNAIDMYRVSDGAYLGSYVFDMPSYELESVSWDYKNNELALLFYKTPGYNYIYSTKAIKIG